MVEEEFMLKYVLIITSIIDSIFMLKIFLFRFPDFLLQNGPRAQTPSSSVGWTRHDYNAFSCSTLNEIEEVAIVDHLILFSIMPLHVSMKH